MLITSKADGVFAKIRKSWAKNLRRTSTHEVMRVSKAIARKMPDLDLPVMPAQARTAFRDVLIYERPPGNGSVEQTLTLAQARGYVAHPCDWVPSAMSDYQFPELYVPWAVWLAEQGYTPFYIGVPLTEANWDRWKPDPRRAAFRHLRRRDRAAGDALLMGPGAKAPAAERLDLLREIGSGGIFYGLYPDDVPIVRHMLNDRSEKVRDLAAEKLAEMDGLETRADHARVLARHFKVQGRGPSPKLNGDDTALKVVVSPELHEPNMMRHIHSTDLETLAEVLGLTPMELVCAIDPENFKSDFWGFLMRTRDMKIRAAYLHRLAEAGLETPGRAVPDGEAELAQRALEVALASEYPSTVFDTLGDKAGTLDVATVRRISHFRRFASSITEELETGGLPVNIQYDPLRIVAFIASKDAAAELLQEALDLGMDPDNPRLTMLKFNLAL
ncbi:hypothetical protein C8N43_1436 [Litoreibacter ponti]|uniref:Uncharacterized protein n=1 Tax=Litoreibacter ponti TaxID=1510457 RepID=A0A2T6BL32_9RHOB|nr:DUF5691 domain-containing protein [Litoreibacter ponti]PTX56774.1 hypothetical protein C8N43_1436 [Litoreibacter ponti]